MKTQAIARHPFRADFTDHRVSEQTCMDCPLPPRNNVHHLQPAPGRDLTDRIVGDRRAGDSEDAGTGGA